MCVPSPPPTQALECLLCGVPPSGGEWTPAAQRRLAELCPSTELHAVEVVHRPQQQAESPGCMSPGGGGLKLAEVEVYLAGQEDGELVAASEVLLDEGHLFYRSEVIASHTVCNQSDGGTAC